MEDRETAGPGLEGPIPVTSLKPIPWLVLMCCLARWCDAQANPPIRQPLGLGISDASDSTARRCC
jgi:hypothetical protein